MKAIPVCVAQSMPPSTLNGFRPHLFEVPLNAKTTASGHICTCGAIEVITSPGLSCHSIAIGTYVSYFGKWHQQPYKMNRYLQYYSITQ